MMLQNEISALLNYYKDVDHVMHVGFVVCSEEILRWLVKPERLRNEEVHRMHLCNIWLIKYLLF